MSKNVITPEENPIVKQARKLEEAKQAEERALKIREAHKKKQEEINQKLQTLEILPMRDKVVILPYEENPYLQVITDSGLYIQPSGSFFNTDTGEMDTMKEFVRCAKVIEVGVETKYIKVGDDIYYPVNAAVPFPFMSQGYYMVSEVTVLAILNENLKERINGNK